VSAYQQLEKHFADIAGFRHARDILDWDNAVMMPIASADVRASATATLQVHIHGMSTAAAIPDWIANAKNESLNPWQLANVREIERGFTLNAALPTDLVQALSNATSKTTGRISNPTLKKYSAYLASKGRHWVKHWERHPIMHSCLFISPVSPVKISIRYFQS
jgi:Zn-dependent M32 family carboxypeptidase